MKNVQGYDTLLTLRTIVLHRGCCFIANENWRRSPQNFSGKILKKVVAKYKGIHLLWQNTEL